MRCRLGLFLAGLMFAQGVCVRPLLAAEPPAGGGAASPNAAVIYWQAFAALPTLEGDQKTKYEAAIKSTAEPVTDDTPPQAQTAAAWLRAFLGRLPVQVDYREHAGAPVNIIALSAGRSMTLNSKSQAAVG